MEINVHLFPIITQQFPACSLKVNGHVPLFPKTSGRPSFENVVYYPSPWALLNLLGSKRRDTTRMSFLLPFLLFPLTQDLFLPNFLARSCGRKSYSMFVCSLRAGSLLICSYKRVLGSSQAGRSTRYLAIIETPGLKVKSVRLLSLWKCVASICSKWLWNF